MIHLDNPAGRLRQVFEILKSHDRDQSKTIYRQAFAEAFGLDPEQDLPWLLERFAIVVRLPAQIRREVAQLDIDGTLFLRRLPDFERVLSSVNLNGRVHGSLNAINDGSMESLLLCSDILHQYRPQPVPTNEERESLAIEIDELSSIVRESREIDVELKEFLLEHLGEMRRALDAVDVAGPVELRDATHRAVGDWVLKYGGAPPQSSATSSFWNIVSKVADILAITVALQVGPSPVPVVELPVVEANTTFEIEVDISEDESGDPAPDADPTEDVP